VSDRDRLLWTAIRRALMMIVSAIDRYVGKDEPASLKRYTPDRHGV
jgi:hypothetical protein